ncbi:MAG: HD domain-containing protein [Armatimonadetes bacterium]|nr:HD domain-containing protein [Armatimonadota bacterium]
MGALHLLNKTVPGGFTTVDQSLLQAVATQLGTAIENARLFEAEQDHARRVTAALDELQSTYDETLKALSSALDLRDNETEGHAQRVTRYAARIAEAMGYSGALLVEIERGALLHDMGKIGIPDGILLKPGRLTEDEWVIMRTHAELGYTMLRNIGFLERSAPIVRHHHERFDGTGYPSALAAEQIPIGARIFAVADTFDAMTSDRPYRKALGYEESCEEILRCAGSQFDPAVVEAFQHVSPDAWSIIRAVVEREIEAKRAAAAAADRAENL